MTDFISIKGVSKHFGEFAAVDDVSLDIAQGELFSILGGSGCGKTTLLRMLAGFEIPTSGSIEIDGVDVTHQPPYERPVNMMFQSYAIFPHMTVEKNIAYGLEKDKVPTDELQTRVAEILDLVKLTEFSGRKPDQLSGGQRQRVALARALAPSPEMLLLDEPFASLDSELRRTLRRELQAMLAQSPVPVMLVTHDREEALALGDSIQVINEGRTLVTGEPLDVLGQPGQGRVARLVGVENLFDLAIQDRNLRDGTMICVGQGLRLEVPLDSHMPDDAVSNGDADRVTVGIRASDIILAKEELSGSSARNQLLGRVVSVESRPPGYAVTLDCGQLLRCHIPGGALDEMGILAGQQLWAVFKASSCFLVDAAPEP